MIEFCISPMVAAWAVSLSHQDVPVYLHQTQLTSGFHICSMVPIHWGGGVKMTDVVSLVRSSVVWPDTSQFHRSKLGLGNGLIPLSKMEIWILLLKIKSIYTIQIGISWRYFPFRQ